LQDFVGSLAQSVEHRTFNAMVPRSNRGRPTIYYITIKRLALQRNCFFVPEILLREIYAT
jgi:hypothetical protein